MQVKITRTALPGGEPRVEVFGDVLDVQVDPINSDNRSQAERNADNALAAARMKRIEAQIAIMLAGIRELQAKGATKIATHSVDEYLRRVLEAPAA